MMVGRRARIAFQGELCASVRPERDLIVLRGRLLEQEPVRELMLDS